MRGLEPGSLNSFNGWRKLGYTVREGEISALEADSLLRRSGFRRRLDLVVTPSRDMLHMQKGMGLV